MSLPKEVQEIIKKMVTVLTLKEKDKLASHFCVSTLHSESILEELENELIWSIQAKATEEDWENTEWVSSDGLTSEEVAIDNENYLLDLEGK